MRMLRDCKAGDLRGLLPASTDLLKFFIMTLNNNLFLY